MEVSGKKAPYLFKRRLTIKETTLRIDYEVVSEKRLSALWSAHPLLRVSPGSRILLPPEVESLLIAGSEGNRLGKPGDRCSWPIFEDISIDVLDHPKKGWADKLFTDALSQGSCGLLDAESEEFVIFRFDPKLTPYLGLWICQGGWPASRPFEDFTVALEPCSGRPDSLAEAAGQDACQLLQPGKPLRWWLEIELGKNPGISIL
jgi:galactose mutarotase-like enzyme